jgi:hypothetical protein
MKTTNKHYQTRGRYALVQFGTLEGPGFEFVPGAEAIAGEKLMIREHGREGTVNTLEAINLGEKYCLLTDMDVLYGAKQNRVVNTSVLIAPHSKQAVNVSCVERSRWSYTSPEFSPAGGVMDPELRSAKVAFLYRDKEADRADSQRQIWGMIHDELLRSGVQSDTEDYHAILESRKTTERRKMFSSARTGCNGLVLFAGRAPVFLEAFGNRHAFRFYFPMLMESIPMGKTGQQEGDPMKEAEAFYRLDEMLDDFDEGMEPAGDEALGGVGRLRWSTGNTFKGFQLNFGKQPVHRVSFYSFDKQA